VLFGCCIPSEQAWVAAKVGWDYVEPQVVELYPDGTDEDFETTRKAIEAAGIPALAFSNLGFPTAPVVGPDVDLDRLRKYVDVIAGRAAQVGAKRLIAESGAARRVPEGFPAAMAARQYREFITVAADTASRHGIAIALEPLNRTETNLLTSVAEAADLAHELGRPDVGVVVNSYHMHVEGEPWRNIELARDVLVHAKACDIGRTFPGSHGLDLWSYFTYLHHVGFDGTVSVECYWESFRHEGVWALDFVRNSSKRSSALGFNE
jgi:D-psicose/D-tagatose/L-ribulose 3-epimerase